MRQAAADNTVRWRGRALQIPASPTRAHFARASVRVHEYFDGTLALFHGPGRIATFPPDPLREGEEAAAPTRAAHGAAPCRRGASDEAKAPRRPAAPACPKPTEKKKMPA